MKKITALTTSAFVYLAIAAPAFAEQLTPCPEGSFQGTLCQTPDIESLINRVITVLLIVALFIAVAFLIWGGIKWITSGGDKGKVESARGTIIGAIVGLVIALAAYLIVTIVYRLVTGQDLGNIELPSLIGG